LKLQKNYVIKTVGLEACCSSLPQHSLFFGNLRVEEKFDRNKVNENNNNNNNNNSDLTASGRDERAANNVFRLLFGPVFLEQIVNEKKDHSPFRNKPPPRKRRRRRRRRRGKRELYTNIRGPVTGLREIKTRRFDGSKSRKTYVVSATAYYILIKKSITRAFSDDGPGVRGGSELIFVFHDKTFRTTDVTRVSEDAAVSRGTGTFAGIQQLICKFTRVGKSECVYISYIHIYDNGRATVGRKRL